jgi:hypothetical protein
MNLTIFVLSRFRTNVLAANHLIIWERTEFDTEQKSSKCLLEIMMLLSSANNIRSDILQAVHFDKIVGKFFAEN